MLSIILGILKVIGILLLILLSLMLVILLAVLFVPLRYQVEGKKTSEDLFGAGGISWLLRSISLTGNYDHDGFWAKLKLFGITVKRIGDPEKKREEENAGKAPGNRENTEGEKKERKTAETEDWEGAESGTAESTAPKETERDTAESKDMARRKLCQQDFQEAFEKEQSPEESWKTPLYPVEKKERFRFWKSLHPIRFLKSFFGRLWQMIAALWEFIVTLPNRVWEFWWKISEFLDEGESRGEALREGWESLKKKVEPFLQQESRAVYKRLLGHLGYLLRSYGPRKIKGWLRLGTGAPDVTGALAGAIYLLLPACAEEFSFQPDFQEQILEGDIVIKGRIQVWCLVRTAFLLWRDQELRKWIRKVKAKGGQSNGR